MFILCRSATAEFECDEKGILYLPTVKFEEVGRPVVPWLSYLPVDPKFADSNPAGVDGFLQRVKILSMTSFGKDVKPWIPCRRFTARKRISSRN